MSALVTVSAPGRVCLFGEHQDYLGLPVIAAAIDRRFRVTGQEVSEPYVRIEMPDLDQRDEFALTPAPLPYRHERDYLCAAVNVLRREGVTLPAGVQATFTSEVPVAAGVSSSSAMVIAWLRFLLELARPGDTVDVDRLARLGHQVEVLEFGEPGGMMDHFCAARGGLLLIDTRPPFAAQDLPTPLDGLILADSGEPKATVEVLRRSREAVTRGLALMRAQWPEFHLGDTPTADQQVFLTTLPDAEQRALTANLINARLTPWAVRSALLGQVDPVAWSHALTTHHGALRDGLDLSTPNIEQMLAAAREAGALGGKVNGSGGGGTVVLLAPGREREVVAALESVEARAWPVRVDAGCRVER